MEKLVNFRDRQELQSVDLSNIGEYARASLDHVVYDGISDQKHWVEFTVTKSATAELTVSDGRIYSSGMVYVSEDDTVFDVLAHLPGTNKRYAAIVAWGQNIDTDAEPRDFLIDAMEGTTEPQAVTMQKLRKANINIVYGTEAAQPQKPTIDSANVVIAWVILNPSDVESIEMETANKLPQVNRNKAALDALEAWKALVSSRVDALASELAKIIARIGQLGNDNDIARVAYDVARLKEINELEDNYTDYGADRYLDENESATGNVNYLAKVEEGCRFDDEAANETAIALFNPIEPSVKVSSGLILPTYTERHVPVVSGFQNAQSISQYTYGTHSCVQKTLSRTRIRYGEEKTICTNNAWWRAGTYDRATQTFRNGGETWEVLNGIPDTNGGTVHWMRLRRFWYDTYTEKYWEHIVTNHNINGSMIAQTFLQPQTAWVTGVGLYFTSKGESGDVNVLICETENGQPALKKVIGKSTLAYANILTASNGATVTKVPFQPTLLESGKRYAIVLITGGNHYVGMAPGTVYAQGTFFVSVDGAYQIGSFEKDLMFSLYQAQFPVTRREINLQALSLSGGISNIDILAAMAVPESCSLTFECQIGGVWKPLNEVASGNTILYGLPALIPFRAVFTGTTDIQPAIDTTGSRLFYSRPRTTFKHISNNITVGTPTQTFKLVVILENYYETNHNLTATINFGAMGGAEQTPVTTTDVELDPPVDARSVNHKRIKRTFTWNNTKIATPQTVFRITLDGATTSALDTFHVAERVHLAF
jgi:hypothetical protein